MRSPPFLSFCRTRALGRHFAALTPCALRVTSVMSLNFRLPLGRVKRFFRTHRLGESRKDESFLKVWVMSTLDSPHPSPWGALHYYCRQACVRYLPLPLVSAPVGNMRALLTTADKRQNRGASRRKEPKELVACLVKGCDTLTPPHLRLCKKCYHECVAGKHSSLLLKSGEKATYVPEKVRARSRNGVRVEAHQATSSAPQGCITSTLLGHQ